MAKHASETSPRRLGRPPKGTRGDTRQELIDAALRLFAKHGYAATTVRQIADEVGIRDSAIYAHFNAKQELLDALTEEAGPQLLDRLGFDLSTLSEMAPHEILPPLLGGLVEAWDKPRARQLMSLLIREGLPAQADMLSAVQERLAPHFRRWAVEGHLRTDIPADLLVWELTAPLVAIRMLYLSARAKPAERRKGRQYAQNHIDYFLATART